MLAPGSAWVSTVDPWQGRVRGSDARAESYPVSAVSARPAWTAPRFTRSRSIAPRCAERKIARSTCAIDACGRACMSSAARPATCGVAIDDPDNVRQPPPGLAEITSTPGATRSGVSGCVRRLNRWLEEKSATSPAASQAPTDSAFG